MLRVLGVPLFGVSSSTPSPVSPKSTSWMQRILQTVYITDAGLSFANTVIFWRRGDTAQSVLSAYRTAMSVYTLFIVSRYDDLKSIDDNATQIEKTAQSLHNDEALRRLTVADARKAIGEIEQLQAAAHQRTQEEICTLKRENNILQTLVADEKKASTQLKKQVEAFKDIIAKLEDTLRKTTTSVEHLSEEQRALRTSVAQDHDLNQGFHDDVLRLANLTARVESAMNQGSQLTDAKKRLKTALEGQKH